MELILDILILLVLGFLGNIFVFSGSFPVVEFFITLIFIAMILIVGEDKGNEGVDRKKVYLKKGLFILFWVLSFYIPMLLFFLPSMILLNTWEKREMYFLVFILLSFMNKEFLEIIYLIILTILGIVLSYRRGKYRELKKQFFEKEDHSNQMYRRLKIENQRLVENQNIEIVNSALQERNRISKEIHDNVGHLLASAILQLAALEFLIPEEFKHPFTKVRETVEEAMEKTRKSVHEIYDQSLNMEVFLKEMKEGFVFCPLHYEIEIEEEPPVEVHYAMVSIIKEALSNVAKHSNGDRVDISLTQVHGKYHLLIKDNGTVGEKEGKGLGLMSMRERVEDLEGNFYLTKDNGYRIFITIPVEEK